MYWGAFLYSLQPFLKREKRFCFVSLFLVEVSEVLSKVSEDSSRGGAEELEEKRSRSDRIYSVVFFFVFM